MPIALLAGQRWNTIGAATLTVAALVALSFAMPGGDVWHAFLDSVKFAQTIVLEQGDIGREKIQSILSAALNFGADLPTAYAIQGALALLLAASIPLGLMVMLAFYGFAVHEHAIANEKHRLAQA